jgi:hypothetical protein
MGAAPQDAPYLVSSPSVSMILHEFGFDDTNFGPNTPSDALTDSVEDEEPALVWLAIANPIRCRRHHQEIERLAETVSSKWDSFSSAGRVQTRFEDLVPSSVPL